MTTSRDNLNEYEWQDEPPCEDGEYFYSGELPSGEMYVGIVFISTDLRTQGKVRFATVFMPPFWRKNPNRLLPEVVSARLLEWTGMWAGPEHGLTHVRV